MAKHEIEAALAEPNRMGPLALILCAMQIRWARGDMVGAVEFAEKAINFTNAKLTSTEVNVSHTLAARSEQDILAELEQLQTKLALANAPAVIGPPMSTVIDAEVELAPDTCGDSPAATTQNTAADTELLADTLDH
jgi:hypothetical protein